MQQSINPANQRKIQALYLKLFMGDQALKSKISQDGILSLGLTGAGKSTLSQLISNAKLKVIRLKGRHVIENQDPSAQVKIGQTTKSCTDIPNHIQFNFKDKVYNIYDCPGFLDTNRFDSVIANAYYVYQLFFSIRKLKFLLVIDQASITGNRALSFIRSVSCFLNLFKFDENFTVQDLSKKTLLVISKATLNLESLVCQIKQVINDQDQEETQNQGINLDYFKNFIKYFQTQENIQIIDMAKQGKPLPTQKVLEKLQNKNFLERNYVDQQKTCLDMKNINFRIGQKQLQGPQIDLAKKAFQKCDQSIQQFVNLVLAAIEQISAKLSQKTQNYDFWNDWTNAIDRYIIFKNREWQFKSKPSKSHLNKLNHLKYIYSVISRYADQNFDYQTNTIHKQILGIMESFWEFTKLKQKQSKILKAFTFILNRKFQQMKVLEQLKKQFTRNNRHSFDILKGFLVNQYQDIQQSYVRGIEILSNQSLEYYTEVIELITKYQSTIQELTQKKSIAFSKKAAIVKSQDNLADAINYFFQSRALSQNSYADANQKYYIKVDVSLNKNIAELLFTIGLYAQALYFYKVIDNTQKILKCYQLIRQKEIKDNKKIVKLLLQQGDYLRDILQFSKAVQIYKQANDLTDNNDFKCQISRKILDIYEKKDIYITNYKQRIQRREFYYRISPQFDKEQVMKKVKDMSKTDQIEQSEFFVSMRFPRK